MPQNNAFNPQQNNFPTIETVSAPTPLVKESRFSGGGYQIGEPTRQIGRTSEEQNYAALAEIAGGTSKSLDIFGNIASAVDKSKIERAGIEWEKINQDESLTFEQKQNKLDEVFKNTHTPILGYNWKDQLQLQADKNWKSKEARNQYEQTRYTEEFASFLNRPENKGHTETAKLVTQFDREYEAKYPSSSSNTWFTLKKSSNSTQYAQELTKKALIDFPIKVDNALPVPSAEQLKVVLDDPTSKDAQQIYGKYAFFFENMDSANTMSPEEFRTYVYSGMTTVLKDFMGDIKEYTPEIQKILLEELPNIAAKKAEEISKVASVQVIRQHEQDALSSIQTSHNSLTAKPTLFNFYDYLTTVSQESGNAKLTTDQRSDLLIGVLPDIIKQWNSLSQGRDSDIVLTTYPEWNRMTPVQKVDVMFNEFNNWIDELSPSEFDRFKKSLNLKNDDELSSFIFAAKRKILSSETTVTDTGKDFSSVKQTFDIVKSRISTTSDNEENHKQLQKVVISAANHWNIKPETLFLIAFNSDNSTAAERTPQQWLDLIEDPVEKQKTRESGLVDFGASQFNGIKESLIGIDTEIKQSMSRAQTKAQKGEDAELDKAAKSFALFSVLDPQNKPKGTLIQQVLDGRLGKTPEHKELKQVISSAWEAIMEIEEESNQYPPNIERIENAQNYLSLVYNAIPGFDLAMQDLRDSYSLFQMQTAILIDSIPRATKMPAANTPEATALYETRSKEMQDELKKVFPRVIDGTFVFSGEPFSGNPVDLDGTWSPEARLYILQAAISSKLTFDKPTEANSTHWKKQFDTVLDRLGTTEDLESDQAKLDITVLAMMAREFKSALMSGKNPNVAGAKYFQDRAVMLGNWAEQYSVEQITKSLNSQDMNKRLQDAILLPITFTKRMQRSRSDLVALETGQLAIPKYLVNDNTKKASSIFLNQAEMSEQGEFRGSIKPSDPKFSIDTSIKTLRQVFGTDLTEEKIADILEKHLLAGAVPTIIPTTIDPNLTQSQKTQQRIRTALIALETVIDQNPTVFLNTSDVYFDAMNQKNTSLTPTAENETQLDMFLHVLAMGLDLDNRNRYIGEASSVPMQTGAISNNLTVGGRYTTPRRQQSQLFFNTEYSIKTTKRDTSYGAAEVTSTLSGLDNSSDVLKETLDKFKPIESGTGSEIKKDDGTNFIYGSVILSSDLPIEQRRQFIKPWLDKNKKDDFIVDNVDPELPFVDWLFAVDAEYRKWDGKGSPLIKDGMTKEDVFKPGGSTLRQKGPRSKPDTLLPTFDWISRDFDGTPMGSINNAFIQDSKPAIQSRFATRQAEILADKKKQDIALEEERNKYNREVRRGAKY